MSQFSLQLSQYIAKSKGDIDQVARASVIGVGDSLVELSPVGDAETWKHPPPPGYVGGRFRANWQMGVNTTPAGDLPDIDPTGQVSKDRITAVIPDIAAGQRYFLVNNLPYAQRLEDGWSGQAPNGMVMITTIKWNNIVEDALNGMKAGGGSMSSGFEAYPL